jgi:hypothetical protein
MSVTQTLGRSPRKPSAQRDASDRRRVFPFNLGSFISFYRYSLFEAGEFKDRFSARRVAWLIFFITLFPLIELVNAFCLLLDEVLFPTYREVSIEAPIFIIGNPRSGTTFLHRLLAKDEAHFVSMATWEIFAAPSITGRRIVQALSGLDRRLGSPINDWLAEQERRWYNELVMHRISLRAPEEDEHLFLHIWSTIMVWHYSGFLEKMRDYVRFDTAISEQEKRRVMEFYASCLRRHLYAHQAQDRIYLAKNPNFSPKVDTLLRYFPDARFIYLARTPFEMVPSFASLMDQTWRIMGDPMGNRSDYGPILDMAAYWYSYPLERLAQEPEDRYTIVNFHEMVEKPSDTVREIYEHFGLEVTPAYAKALQQANMASEEHESRHSYEVADAGRTKAEMATRFKPVLERFDFPPSV